MPLASEFQRKQQLEARQFQATQPRTGPTIHPEDTLIVRNILVGDDTEVQDVIPYANAKQGIDPNSGAPHFVNQIETEVYEHSWSTKDFFEVRWDGRPHRIKPGETRRMPRYLADHFAKILIDFILTEREEKEKLTGLLKNRNERTKLYKQIIIGVDSYYNGDLYDYQREGNFVEQQVEQLNSSPNVRDLGEVPPVALGWNTTDKAPEHIDDYSLPTPSLDSDNHPATQEELVATKTKDQLMTEARQLGIEVKPQWDKATIASAILAF